jgi:hypothetical protein
MRHENNKQSHQCPDYIMNMLTFFAALRNKMANSPSLKLSVSAIIDNIEIVNADLQRNLMLEI